MSDAQKLFGEGFALHQAGQAQSALACYDAALAADPGLVRAHYNRAVLLAVEGRSAEALAGLDATLSLAPRFAEALAARGNVLRALERLDEAVAMFDLASSLKPDPGFFNNRGGVLLRLKRNAEALASFDAALARAPEHHNAAINKVVALQALGRETEAIEVCETMLVRHPGDADFSGRLFCLAQSVCDWARMKPLERPIHESVEAGATFVQPFELLGAFDDPALQLRCARNHMRALPSAPVRHAGSHGNARIRIAYLSADYGEHATALLMARLFELHDRSRFEIIGLDFGPDPPGPMRIRLRTAFDQFHDIERMSDAEAARLIADLKIDIAVDLKGHTDGSRPQILSHRPAPVQAAYLGYPGTMGAGFIDYVIADPVVVPLDHQLFYDEKIVQLPHSYQATDDTRPLPNPPFRAEAGLPPDGFVFVSFNNHWKITQAVFDIWMRLLASLPGSVLWLLDGPGRHNLEQAAAARGIDPSRLVFAPRTGAQPHINRLALADLMLDTFPCNGHTTASDALWAGVPLVTCAGVTFASRVAASLLHAIGLDELVMANLSDYEALAFRLAHTSQALASLRARLAENRRREPLFDSRRFTRNLEKAYEAMHRRAAGGEVPESFVISD